MAHTNAFAGLLAVAACVAAAPAAAGDYLEDAPVAYSAEVEVRAGANVHRGRIFHRPGMQRRAFAGGARYQILRFDRGVTWNVDPGARRWWPESLSAAGLLSRAQLSLVQAGEARVLGRPARVYRISGALTNGPRVRGQAWIGHAGILLKAQFAMKSGPRRWAWRMRLITLTVASQDASLFSLPPAWPRRSEMPAWRPGNPAAARPRAGKDAPQSLEDLFRR